MSKNKMFFILFISVFTSLAYSKCNWCVSEKKDFQKRAAHFLDLSPSEQIKKIENEGIKVLILKADKEVPSLYFQWKSVRTNEGKLSNISKYEGSLGKTLCRGEREIAKDKKTIILNADAPMSTLLHEYLHTMQISSDESWCKTSKNLWGNLNPNEKDMQELHNREWDVRKVLWTIKDHKSLNIEDQILIAEGFINESNWQLKYDSQVKKIIEKEKPAAYLSEKIAEFQTVILKYKAKANSIK